MPSEPDAADPSFWVKSDWSREDLQGKRVAFRLVDPEVTVTATGVFRIGERPSGEKRIEIVVETVPSYWQRRDYIFTLRQRHADYIKKHRDSAVADFELVM